MSQIGNEQKPVQALVQGCIFNIQDYAVNDGVGIRTVVFMKGCPLRCDWCANPEGQESYREIMHSRVLCKGCRRCADACTAGAISFDGAGERIVDRSRCRQCEDLACERACQHRALRVAGAEWTAEELFQRVRSNMVYYRNSGGGVTLSGGEPLAQGEFVQAFVNRCETIGLSVGVETSGLFDWERVADWIEKLDFYFFDLKCMDSQRHASVTHCPNEPVIANLRRLAALGADKITVTLAVIPGVNDMEENARQLAALCMELGITKVRLLPYHTLGMEKYRDLGRMCTMEEGLAADAVVLDHLCTVIEESGIECWVE